jgi:predicted nucleotidyltransferase
MAIQLPSSDDLSRELWDALLEVADHEPENWTLVGAQMVLLHALEHNRTPPRRTSDLDVILNVRSVAMTPSRFAETLESLGYELEGVNADGVGHRFKRDQVKFDVLLPDGIGARAPREITPGARTVEVPGGTQALRRTQMVSAESESRTGSVPRPNLLGAILVKTRAVDVDDVPNAQREDLAFLLSLVTDPYEMSGELSRSERGWLRRRSELLDPAASAWRAIDNADDGRLALEILVGE